MDNHVGVVGGDGKSFFAALSAKKEHFSKVVLKSFIYIIHCTYNLCTTLYMINIKLYWEIKI